MMEIMNFLIDESNKPYLSLYKEGFIQYINSEHFKSKLELITIKENYNIRELMDLFYDYFKSYDPKDKDLWLESIFHYTINKSFPHRGISKLNNNLQTLYLLFLNSLRLFIKLDTQFNYSTFFTKYPISFLTSEEVNKLKYPTEYNTFIEIFNDNYIYELMLLDKEVTGHNTLEHVVGVNYLSVFISKQLYKLGLPIEMGLVVGSGLIHDIGKYGVLDIDSNKIPYYHYYYTEDWSKRFGLDKIGHIATNHSVWDLELTTLPLESLLLIYSDFRVKNQFIDGEYQMTIFTLEDSFDVILDKLDNLDSIKQKRYEKAYKKLKDFEDYLIHLGVNISLDGDITPNTNKPYTLMNSKEVITNLKFESIEHNIGLMSILSNDTSFNHIIDTARGENNWRAIRLYLQIFREYSIYLTQKQKITTLHFLQDLLFHKEEDIRKEAAELIGLLIALYDEPFRKEIPNSIIFDSSLNTSDKILDEILNFLLYPDHKIVDSQRQWLYNLKTIIESLFENAQTNNYIKYFDILNKYYCRTDTLSAIAEFYLSKTIKSINLNSLDEVRQSSLFNYVLNHLNSNDTEVRLSTLDIISYLLSKTSNIMLIASIRNWILNNLDHSTTLAEDYLKYKIGKIIYLEDKYLTIFADNYGSIKSNTSEVFLENLKTATNWMKKKINIDILYDQVRESPSSKGLHTAMHFCNLLKVSAIEKVRNYAGETLLNIFPYLSKEEKNDVAIELLRALEMDNYHVTKFIPDYLGRLILLLPPTELDELIDDFEEKIKVSSTQLIFLLLSTVGVCIENYFNYSKNYKEDEITINNRLSRLLGVLIISMASYDNDIKIEGFRVISSKLFDSGVLTLDNKYKIFAKISKKILTLINTNKNDDFLFYNNSASLTHIYHFISEYEFIKGDLSFYKKQNIAFFPGSFDPFSLSHREIATEIRNYGFEVYLAVDEFSWSKRTEPHSFRANIVQMSIAKEEDIYLYPSELPINLSNQKDLDKLTESFSSREVYIVAGTDVLFNASAYKKEGKLLDFPHIIFDRKASLDHEENEDELQKRIEGIRANVLRLSLPPQYEDISSTQIRENIDLNRDISKTIDPLAQEYIYDYGLYLKEPLYKTLLLTKSISVEIYRELDDNTIDYLLNTFGDKINLYGLLEIKKKLSYRVLLLKDNGTNQILGISAFYWVRHSLLFEEFNNTHVTEYIRRNAKGRTALITGLLALNGNERYMETLLNETLSVAINRDYNYALFSNSLSTKSNEVAEELISLQGFLNTGHYHNNEPLYLVDMNNPCTLNLDLGAMLKPPFNQDANIQSIIHANRKRLKKSLSNLYPGELLLVYHRDMIYSKLVQKICDLNNVSTVENKVRNLGEFMCVPFGSILNNSIIPNTVTKTLHTERIFKPSIKSFTIGPAPYHLSLENQCEVIKSFNRPAIFVDDILNKGYRLQVVVPLVRNANMEIKKLIVGILSGRGKEFAKINNIPVEFAYFVPNLKLWFNESSHYPFIGGDMVSSDDYVLNSLLIPSINFILPYVSPSFIKNTSKEAIYDLSETCLKNTYNIFKGIEESYQSINEKHLNINRLSEVLINPRHPDNKNMNLNKNIKASKYIEMDLEYLYRLKDAIKS